MNIPAVLRIAAQPVSKSPGITRAESSSRSDGTRGRADHSGQTFATPSSGKAQQAAVVQFGSQALNLARESEEGEASTATADVDDSRALSDAPEFNAIESREDSDGSESPEGESPAPERQTSDSSTASDDELSSEEQQQIGEMRRRDQEVRTHEQAHKAAGGGHTGSINLDFEVGPDGKRYAVAGSVSIDVSGVADDAEATLRKMEVVQRAALAPARPSGADRQVASSASRQAQQARAQIAAEKYSQTQENLTEQLPERPGVKESEPGLVPEPVTLGSPREGRGFSAEGRNATPFSLVA